MHRVHVHVANFIEENLYLSRSNQLETYFVIKMSVEGFPKHQNKTSDTNRYEEYFFSARICQVNVNAMKRLFEQRSEL